MATRTIHIATDFSKTPAGRFYSDGPYSGEKFRTELLAPALKEADEVVVDMAGVFGFGSSFLDEAFGGLIRKSIISKNELLAKMKITAPLEIYSKKVLKYISDARPGE